MSKKPSIPKGTRDFAPAEVAKRQYIFSIIKSQFEIFGFQPIETPSFENSETLMGKYGEEGDRLIFKILNSGDYLEKKHFDEIKVITDLVNKLINDDLFDLLLNDNIIKSFNDFDKKKIEKIIISQIDFKLKNHISNTSEENELLGYLKRNIELLVENVLNILNIKSGKITFNDESQKIRDKIKYTNAIVSKIVSKKLTSQISEKALRYDLTVPFARYVVQHQNEIEFPFKRYQIQPVWRADRPQKGRFREFYQCDADVVGSNSLLQEVELVQLYDAVFAQLGLHGVTIKMNNRKILSGIAEVIGASEQLIDFTVALDKLDKIGEEGVKKEMLEKGITANAIEKVQPLFHFTGSNQDKINQLSALLANSSEGLKGVEEMQFVVNQIEKLGLNHAFLTLDVTLARGLNYYTGAIFEVQAPEVAMGSIGGGGRYDDLTGIFGLKNMSGVGISFGLDRIYLVLEELNLFPPTVAQTLDVLFLNQNPEQAFVAMKTIKILRDSNIKADLYPDAAKMDKQFKYAEKRGIPLVVKDCQEDVFQVKNLQSGTQSEVSFTELIELLK